jgi:hypothetical protein
MSRTPNILPMPYFLSPSEQYLSIALGDFEWMIAHHKHLCEMDCVSHSIRWMDAIDCASSIEVQTRF